jgi:sigma-B regulation protein RsbU (phosphoserine phosphatase)
MLRTHLARFPGLRNGVDRTGTAITAWRERAALPEITVKRSGNNDQAVALVSAGQGSLLFHDASESIRRLRQGILAELNRQQARLDSARALLTQVLLGTLVLSTAVLLAAAFLLERWVHTPLEALSQSVRDVAAGDLDHQIPSSGPPDLAELGADVERMRRRILQELDDAGRAREALARRGLVVLTLRDELAASQDGLPPTLAVASRYEPAEGIVAGDWWDVVRLDDDRTALVLVDVSGHGAASGVFALRAKQLIVAALRSHWSPAETLAWVAQSLGDTGEQFLTGVVVEVEASTGRCRYVNAGHPHILLRNADGLTRLGPTGPVLGPLPGRWETREATIGPSGLLVLYTDGLIEARDDRREEFGVERLEEALRSVNGSDPEKAADACLTALRSFTAGRPDDDVTLVVLGRTDFAVTGRS